MALQASDPSVAPSAQVVANAFVEQYYHILHHSPELVYRFYQDSSVLSRQDENGEMKSVTTMQGINAKILSLDYKNYKAEIKTADAQESYKDGVIVLVTGCLTGKDKLRKKFAQSFFLAPQAKGYFVLNDVFRYIDDTDPSETNSVSIEKVDDSGSAQPLAETEVHAPGAAALDVPVSNENSQIHVEKSFEKSEKEGEIVAEKEEICTIPQSNENHISAVAESSHTSGQDDGTKNSYASIVKKAKGSPGPTKVYVPTNTVRSAPSNTQKQSAAVAETSVQTNSKAPENVNVHEEVEGYSIYVRNLPMNVTVDQLEAEFKKFGPIKQEGVQVRSNRQQGSCYGFVEFLSASAMESAIQASPVIVGGRQAFVEVKRTTTRVDGGRGRFLPGRGGFRGDSFRGRGGYGGGRGFGRNDFGGRGEYSSRGRGPAGRGGEGYQRGRGRATRPSGMHRNSIAT